MNVTEAYVDGLALNASAIKNGRDLMRKNGYPSLCVSEDGAVIFGHCGRYELLDHRPYFVPDSLFVDHRCERRLRIDLTSLEL